MAATRDRLMFDRVFVTSPMVLLPDLPFGLHGAARLMRALRFLGLSRLPFGRADDKPQSEASFPNNPLTGDKARYMRAVDVLAAMPELGIGLPTLGWIGSSLDAMVRVSADDFPGSLKIPVFMCLAALDRVVYTSGAETLGLRMRNGHHVVIPGARHEMLMETDAIREQVFAAFDAFITEQAN
jgi:lysophospholipase